MSLIETTLEGTINKVDMAIDRIRAYEPISHGFMDEPYYVCYSGGKDSDALRILFEMAGVKYDLVHNLTTVDAPETVYYIRTIPNITISKPQLTMWQLIEKKLMPPTRRMRYCCAELKERGGVDRFVSTGVRWAESANRRKKRDSLEVQHRDIKKSLMLNADNDENRKLFENCAIKGKRILNPIIDWTDDDVWEFLNYAGCKSNPLYACGYKRVGCVGCPMAGAKGMTKGFERYPKYKNAYIRAFDRAVAIRKARGLDTNEYATMWDSGQHMFDWWLSEKQIPIDVNQIDMFGLEA